MTILEKVLACHLDLRFPFLIYYCLSTLIKKL